MKILYNASTDSRVIPISTGGCFQHVLVWFEDNDDWFVYFADTNTSQAYIHKIVNKLETSADRLFSGLNMDVLTDEEFDYYEKWINSNFNYQGLHKNEEIDEVKSLPYQSTFIGL